MNKKVASPDFLYERGGEKGKLTPRFLTQMRQFLASCSLIFSVALSFPCVVSLISCLVAQLLAPLHHSMPIVFSLALMLAA